MRRFAAVAAVIIAAVLTSGCAADEFSGNTQQSYSGASAEYSADSVEYSAEATAEEYSAPTAEPQASAAPTVESAAVDPVRLAEGLSAEFLGLPDSGKVYIFRDKKESVTINGAEYFGVTCLDEEDGRLESLCDIYISPDGATAYRYHPEDGSYRLLPEQIGRAHV